MQVFILSSCGVCEISPWMSYLVVQSRYYSCQKVVRRRGYKRWKWTPKTTFFFGLLGCRMCWYKCAVGKTYGWHCWLFLFYLVVATMVSCKSPFHSWNGTVCLVYRRSFILCNDKICSVYSVRYILRNEAHLMWCSCRGKNLAVVWLYYMHFSFNKRISFICYQVSIGVMWNYTACFVFKCNVVGRN